MAGRPVAVKLPDGRTLRGTTDAAGRFPFVLDTEGFAKEQGLRVVAQLPEDGIEAAAIAALAVHGFRIERDRRDVYLSGEAFPLQVVTRDATGEPTGQELTVTVVKRITTRPVAVTDDEPFRLFEEQEVSSPVLSRLPTTNRPASRSSVSEREVRRRPSGPTPARARGA